MKVICIDCGIKSPIADHANRTYIKEGEIYTVKNKVSGFSTYANRTVYAYEFYEITGYYERALFIPLSNIKEKKLCTRKNLTAI